MIVVNLKGGIGNQMFQYAFGRYLSNKYNVPLLLNKSIYDENRSNRTFDLDIFRLNNEILYDISILEDAIDEKGIFILNEMQFSFNESVMAPFDTGDNTANIVLIISGFWQSFKYFLPIESLIRTEFSFLNPLTGKWRELYNLILTVNSVMINVRRGDYMTKLDYHGVVSIEYINASMELCRKKIKDPVFFIFSDDMAWSRNNISQNDNVVFVDETYYDIKYQFYLQLMSACKHFILSNSSFAWWSAWLSAANEQKIVIAPKQWFVTNELDTKDLTPESWIRI